MFSSNSSPNADVVYYEVSVPLAGAHSDVSARRPRFHFGLRVQGRTVLKVESFAAGFVVKTKKYMIDFGASWLLIDFF